MKEGQIVTYRSRARWLSLIRRVREREIGRKRVYRWLPWPTVGVFVVVQPEPFEFKDHCLTLLGEEVAELDAMMENDSELRRAIVQRTGR